MKLRAPWMKPYVTDTRTGKTVPMKQAFRREAVMRQIIFKVTNCPRGGRAKPIKCAICDASIMKQTKDATTGRRSLVGQCRELRNE